MQKNLREIQIVGSGTREWIVWRSGSQGCAALGEFGISYAGVTDAAKDFQFVRQDPHMEILLACVAGAGEAKVASGMQPLRPRRAYLAPARMPHAYRARSKKRWQICWVAFDEPLPGRAGILHTQEPLLVSADQARMLRRAIIGLYRERNGAADLHALRRWAWLTHHYAQKIAGGGSVGIDAAIRRLFEIVDANLARPWSLRSLADLAAISPEYLRDRCQRQYANSPIAHLTSLRMQRAAALLRLTDHKIALIARNVGYSNPFAFSAAFSRTFTQSPSSYRRTQS